MKIFVMILSFSIIGINQATALTPTEYCKTLAAVSCEILNIDQGSTAVEPYQNSGTSYAGTGNGRIYSFGLIKYCRNQIFKIVPMSCYNTTVPGSIYTCAVKDYSNNDTYPFPSSALCGVSTMGSLP